MAEVLMGVPFEYEPKRQNRFFVEFTDDIKTSIAAASSGENPSETFKGTVHSVRINSQAVIKSWQQRLSQADIVRVRQLTDDIAPLYYTPEDWL